jgi:hypothetical protein
MAVHRRPPLQAAPPVELLRFVPDEWAGGEWWESFHLWGEARLEFVRQHKGTALGTALDVLREHRRIHREHLGWKVS